jgi:hypothetical protein
MLSDVLLSVVMLSIIMLSDVLLSVVMLSIIRLSVIRLSVIRLSVIRLSVVVSVFHAVCSDYPHSADCQSGECRYAECRGAKMTTPNVFETLIILLISRVDFSKLRILKKIMKTFSSEN